MTVEPAKRATALAITNVNRDVSSVARSAGLNIFTDAYLGFRFAPPQALCFHPLRGLLLIVKIGVRLAILRFSVRSQMTVEAAG